MIKIQYFVNAIRSLGLQSIMKAKQGHPGMVISAAPINYAVYVECINISSENPKWINRDRFVLSAGHGSMSLYPIFHFARLIDLDKFQNFRQKISGLPGHPENVNNPYIEATTGPLGQGIANAVGMAIAEAFLEEKYKKLEGLINHYTFAVVGDGDLQEGISYEAMSLAGKLNLEKLIVLHDSNNYQLETSVKTVNIENLELRVTSMNWNYITCTNDPHTIIRALKDAKKINNKKPTFIEVKTEIGEGLSFANSSKAHGGSITEKEMALFNSHFQCNFDNWNFDAKIYYHFFKNITEKGNFEYNNWKKLLEVYKKQYPELTNEFLQQINNNEVDIRSIINSKELPKNKATRVVAGWIMNKLNEQNIKNILVLSPDVSKSTNILTNTKYFNDNKQSNMIMNGVREFSMMAIQNGIQLHGGFKSISSVFLAFSDYLKSALRVACISEIDPIVVFTHDSIAIGADGPTHQPIEQIGTLRSIPKNNVYRPCDEKETLAAFIDAFSNNKKNNFPTSIILSRQNLLSLENTNIDKTINQGGYSVFNNSIDNDITICASGSEVQLAIKITSFLKDNFNITTNVISVPNLEKFINNKDINDQIKSKYGLVSIEASNDSNWYKLGVLVNNYCNISVNQYGYSIDGEENYSYLGFNVLNITTKIINTLFIDDQDKLNKFKQFSNN